MTLDEMILEFKESADGQEQRLKGLREKDINTYVRMKAAANVNTARGPGSWSDIIARSTRR